MLFSHIILLSINKLKVDSSLYYCLIVSSVLPLLIYFVSKTSNFYFICYCVLVLTGGIEDIWGPSLWFSSDRILILIIVAQRNEGSNWDTNSWHQHLSLSDNTKGYWGNLYLFICSFKSYYKSSSVMIIFLPGQGLKVAEAILILPSYFLSDEILNPIHHL